METAAAGATPTQPQPLRSPALTKGAGRQAGRQADRPHAKLRSHGKLVFTSTLPNACTLVVRRPQPAPQSSLI